MNDLVELVDSSDRAVTTWNYARSVEFVRKYRVENIIDQSRFSRAADAGNSNKESQWKCDVDAF